MVNCIYRKSKIECFKRYTDPKRFYNTCHSFINVIKDNKILQNYGVLWSNMYSLNILYQYYACCYRFSGLVLFCIKNKNSIDQTSMFSLISRIFVREMIIEGPDVSFADSLVLDLFPRTDQSMDFTSGVQAPSKAVLQKYLEKGEYPSFQSVAMFESSFVQVRTSQPLPIWKLLVVFHCNFHHPIKCDQLEVGLGV